MTDDPGRPDVGGSATSPVSAAAEPAASEPAEPEPAEPEPASTDPGPPMSAVPLDPHTTYSGIWVSTGSDDAASQSAGGQSAGGQSAGGQSAGRRSAASRPEPAFGPRLHQPAAPARRSAVTLAVLGGVLLAMIATGAVLIGRGGGSPAAGSAPSGAAGSTPAATSAAAPGPLGSATPVPPAPSHGDPVTIAEQVLPSTVTIYARRGSGGDTGSGFVIDAANGYILTNNHVVADAATRGARLTVAFTDGRQASAMIVGRSPAYDLAVIKVHAPGELVSVPLGDSSAVRVGEQVLAFGSPLGLGGTVTEGIISATERPVDVGSSDDESDVDAPGTYIDGLQTDAAINPGNSGGPLVDAAGRVIGIDSAILTLGSSQGGGQPGSIGLGFAIPINQARVVADELITGGRARYPTIGIRVGDDDTTAIGVEIAQLAGDGPAARAGLVAGDQITAVDDRPVLEPVELIVLIRSHRPGDTVSVTYERHGRTARATVVLGGKVG